MRLSTSSVRFAQSTLLSQLFMMGSTLCSIVFYSPEAVGIYGAGLALVYSAGYFSGLRIDALMLANSESQERLFQLSCWVQRYQSIVVFLISFIYFRNLVLAILVTAVSYFFSYTLLFIPYALRHNHTKRVAYSRVHGTWVLVVGQVMCSFSYYGLVLGDILGKVVHMLLLKRGFRTTSLTRFEAIPLLKLYLKPIIYMNASSLGTALSMYAPLLIVTLSVGPEKGAVFFLVQRIAGFTEQLIGYTSYQLVVSGTSEKRSGQSLASYKRSVSKLVGYSLLLVILTAVGLLVLFQFPILRDWNQVLPLFLLYVPLCLSMTWTIPLRTLLMTKGQWRTICLGELGRGLAITGVCITAVTLFPLSYEQVICLGGALFTACCLVYYLRQFIQQVAPSS